MVNFLIGLLMVVLGLYLIVDVERRATKDQVGMPGISISHAIFLILCGLIIMFGWINIIPE